MLDRAVKLDIETVSSTFVLSPQEASKSNHQLVNVEKVKE